MQGRAGTWTRVAITVVVCLAAASVLVGSSTAIPRKRAVAIALKALAPTKVKGSVVVYGLPTPLPAGTIVSEAGPSGTARTSKLKGRAQLITRVRSWKTAKKAWLFWMDLAPGAYWSHPTRLVLVDDATGRVTASAKLGWWPLVNGRPAAFVVRPKSFRVYSKLPKQVGAGSMRTTASARAPDLPRFVFEKDCIVYVVDETATGEAGANLRGDLLQMKQWANAAGFGSRSGEAKSAAEIESEVDRLVKDGCNDVVIFLAGHGLAKPGTLVNGQPVASSDEATVLIGNVVKRAAGGGWETIHNPITSSDIATVTGKYQKQKTVNGREVAVSPVKFKLIVDSCFSRRFEEDLEDSQKGDDPPIRVIATSSDDGNITIASGFGNTDKNPNPNNASYWVLGLTNVLTDVMKRTDLADQGDLAAIIDEAVALERDDPEKYGDYASKVNHPNSNYSSGSLHPLGEPIASPVFYIHANFVQSDRTTTYSLVYTKKTSISPTYAWKLEPPEADPKCNNSGHGGATGDQATFAWYHGDDQCSHSVEDPQRGHKGTVFVTVTFRALVCKASYFGTATGDDTTSICTVP